MLRAQVFISKFHALTGFVDPLGGEVVVTSPFGKLRKYENLPEGRAHNGTDYRARWVSIKAIADGVVEYIGDNHVFEGNIIVINHGGALNGRWEGLRSYSMHLSEFKVGKGHKVRKRQVIAISGDTASSAPHLHLTVKMGDIYVDFEKLKGFF